MGTLRIHCNDASKILSSVPARTWESLKECKFPPIHSYHWTQKTYLFSLQGAPETELGNVDSHRGIDKTHLEFHLWKSCPLLLPCIRRPKDDSGSRNTEFWEGKERGQNSHLFHASCYSWHQAFLYVILFKAPQVSLPSRIIAVMGISDTGLFSAKQDWRTRPNWRRREIRKEVVRPARRRRSHNTAPPGGWLRDRCAHE